jgi:3-oxoacyl-[acyl-carrier-protein] synthase II
MSLLHRNGKPRRVVITGMGVICPLGNSPAELWEALVAGRSGVASLTTVPSNGLPVPFAAEARQFTGAIEDFGDLDKELKKSIRKGLKVMCRECQMGVAVAQRALADAKLLAGACDPERIGISFGADYMLSQPDEFIAGVQNSLDDGGRFEFSRWGTNGMPLMSPLWLLKYLPNMPASHVAIYNDFRGPNNSITLREAAANLSVGEAFRIIAEGRADAMIVGTTGTRLHPMKTIHCVQQDELATEADDPATASRPFDRNRTGVVLGEGAGAIVLEELNSAKARGATIHGEVVARASSSVAGAHLVARRDEALRNVLAIALAEASVSPDGVGHIHAHGLSTRTGDAEEAAAIQAVFGGRAKPVPVVAAKSHFGNLGAGSGMVELVASVLALDHGRLFPVLNYETPDPECPVAAVTDAETPSGDSFVNLSVTPQGQASSVLVRRFE